MTQWFRTLSTFQRTWDVGAGALGGLYQGSSLLAPLFIEAGPQLSTLLTYEVLELEAGYHTPGICVRAGDLEASPQAYTPSVTHWPYFQPCFNRGIKMLLCSVL